MRETGIGVVVARAWRLAPWLGLLALAACSSNDQSPIGSTESPVCTVGQTSGCRCLNGLPPEAAGCQTASAGMGAAGSGLLGSAGNAVPASAGASAMTAANGGAGASAAGGAAPAGSTAGAGGSPLTAAGAGGGAAGSGGIAGSGEGAGMAGSAGGSAAGSGGDSTDDCGAGGVVGKASNGGAAQGRGAGSVQLTVAAGNQILDLRTTMEVPVKPTGNSTLFLWPGLEPLQGTNYQPIGTGVLQPVLTWGGSCAPGSPQTQTGMSWWISGQYVNTLAMEPKHTGCYGGPIMTVAIGNQLLIDMRLKSGSTIWNQTITNQANNKSVDFDMDMAMQPQRWALFEIETPTSTHPASDVVFTNTVMTLEKSEPKACQPSSRGANDYFSKPIASSDGLRCCIARIVLRAQGVAATTMDPAP